jgi:hypothetical protein
MSNNTAKSNSFLAVIAYDAEKKITLELQNTNLGSLSLNPAPMAARFADIPFPGDKAQFNELTMSFLLDEDLTQWQFLNEWIFDLANAEFTEKEELITTIEVIVYDRQNAPTIRMRYFNASPISISDIDYDLTSEETNLTCSANFVYSHYHIENVKTGKVIAYDRRNQ